MKNTRYTTFTVTLLLGLSVMGASSYAYAQPQTTGTIGPPIPQTELQKLMNSTVKDRIIVDRLRVIVSEGSTPSVVTAVGPNLHYRLELRIRNTGSELTFENVQLRVQGLLPQVAFFTDCTFTVMEELDYQNKPRITIEHNTPLSHGAEPTLEACFVVRRDMRVSDLQFKVGVYAVIRPEGHAWHNLNPAQ